MKTAADGSDELYRSLVAFFKSVIPLHATPPEVCPRASVPWHAAQYTVAEEAGNAHVYIAPASTWENGYCESFEEAPNDSTK